MKEDYIYSFASEKKYAIDVCRKYKPALKIMADVHEPEDHIAALCEVMSMLIEDDQSGEGLPPQQSLLFERHIAPWADRFFHDLSESEAAVFYRSVGRLGTAFMEFEGRYLSMKV